MNSTTYKIKGMSCGHCKATVEKAIGALPGVESVEVNLADGSANVKGKVDASAIAEAVTKAGFDMA